jgi:hypothetical protein
MTFANPRGVHGESIQVMLCVLISFTFLGSHRSSLQELSPHTYKTMSCIHDSFTSKLIVLIGFAVRENARIGLPKPSTQNDKAIAVNWICFFIFFFLEREMCLKASTSNCQWAVLQIKDLAISQLLPRWQLDLHGVKCSIVACPLSPVYLVRWTQRSNWIYENGNKFKKRTSDLIHLIL